MIELKVQHNIAANITYFALHVDGEYVGGCEFTQFGNNCGKGITIEDFTIFENHRRKGYGKHLLKCLDEHELTRDAIKTLLVYADNEAALNLYASAGYVRRDFIPAGIITQDEIIVMSKQPYTKG